MTAVLLLIGFIVLLFFGMPIAWVLGIISTLWVYISGIDVSIVASRIQTGINSFVLMAIPFFIMAGAVMNKVGITDRLVRFCNMFFGRWRGGMAHVCIYAEMIFAGITGSALADIAALGKVFIPPMVKQGYNKAWAIANLCNTVIIGPIIPPSIIVVIYGATTGISIGGLLLGCALPGILMGVGQSVFIALVAKRKNLPKVPMKVAPKEYVTGTMAALPALIMPLIILGGIFTGIVTPTESAALAVLYALILGFAFYKTIDLRDVISISITTAKESAMLYFIIGVSGILGWMLAKTGTAVAVTNYFLSITNDGNIMVLIVLLVLIFMGTWLDASVIIVLIAPIIAPMMHQLGFNPIHFGCIFIITVCFGLITPPLGVVLFAASSITGVKIEKIVKEIWPFMLLDIGLILLFVYVPEISLWIPRMAGLV